VEDCLNDKIGSTKCGVKPAKLALIRGDGKRVSDYAKVGERYGGFLVVRAEEVMNPVEHIHPAGTDLSGKKWFTILNEGAQAFNLDPTWTPHPPFQTSSPCTSGEIYNAGVSALVREHYVIQAIKAGWTYVGAYEFQDPNDEVAKLIQSYGKEFGATTNRMRQCRTLDMDVVQPTLIVNGVRWLIINKVDVLEAIKRDHPDLDVFAVVYQQKVHVFDTIAEWEAFVERGFREMWPALDRIDFSRGPSKITEDDDNLVLPF
jgi:adenylosuccinate synthase